MSLSSHHTQDHTYRLSPLDMGHLMSHGNPQIQVSHWLSWLYLVLYMCLCLLRTPLWLPFALMIVLVLSHLHADLMMSLLRWKPLTLTMRRVKLYLTLSLHWIYCHVLLLPQVKKVVLTTLRKRVLTLHYRMCLLQPLDANMAMWLKNSCLSMETHCHQFLPLIPLDHGALCLPWPVHVVFLAILLWVLLVAFFMLLASYCRHRQHHPGCPLCTLTFPLPLFSVSITLHSGSLSYVLKYHQRL